ncbi:5'/3'-nucleotidase SurE [Dactylosporangium sp. CA-092794]|uniref:5'/3'-nucleotidase SurE n=1 Tax=Dactylosporangium sp. CA-092794 TaxID=3239929 RepID=UPI003D89C457
MRILITNDDGIAAPGIRHLARAVHALGHDVVVAAPGAEASGSSAALTAVTEDGRLMLDTVAVDGLPGVPGFGVKASPGYIAVLAGLGAFGDRPDAVLSGINRGANAGHAILHSGTVGAALTAANHGMRALAVSLDVLSPAEASSASGGAAFTALIEAADNARHWAGAADLAARLLSWLAAAPPGTVLNLNVPDRPADVLRGLRRATLAPFGQVQMAIAEHGKGYVRTSIEERGERLVPGSDIALLAEGYATVTAVTPPTANPGLEPPPGAWPEL